LFYKKQIVFNNNINHFVLTFSITLLSILFFVENNDFIKTADGQANMDTFTARGIIFTQLSQSPLLNDQNSNETESINNLLNKSINSTQSNANTSPPLLQGQWALEVNKGEVSFFRVLFSLSQNDKLVNAFALYNLSDTRYIQLNDKGTEIITGTVDLTSLGKNNETIHDIDTTITINSLTRLRVSLDENMVGKFFNESIMGATRFLADGSGNIIIQPAPPQAQRNPSIPSIPTPQGNSFYGSNLVF
jgi:hypothetical protein